MPEGFDADRLVRQVEGLPPLPEALAEFVRALGSDALPAQRCVALIEGDQALAACTLRLANSAFYGVPRRVACIGDAVSMLGLRTLFTLLTAATLRDTLGVADCPGFDFEQHWRLSFATAIAARTLAPVARQEPDVAFLAGLMHDLGQLVLAAFEPALAGRALALSRASGLSAEAAEQAVLGIDHAELGARLAARWHFPAEIVQAIARHHAPPTVAPAAPPPMDLCTLVRVAHAVAQACVAGTALAADAAALLDTLGVSGAERDSLLAAVAQGTREMSDILAGS